MSENNQTDKNFIDRKIFFYGHNDSYKDILMIFDFSEIPEQI